MRSERGERQQPPRRPGEEELQAPDLVAPVDVARPVVSLDEHGEAADLEPIHGRRPDAEIDVREPAQTGMATEEWFHSCRGRPQEPTGVLW
jgi:hypothetical protein